jgi:hypothetical protein
MYESLNNKNYKKHCGTEKHIFNCKLKKNIYKCKYCSSYFNDKTTKDNHQSNCFKNKSAKEDKNIELKDKIIKSEYDIKFYQNNIEILNEKINDLKEELKSKETISTKTINDLKEEINNLKEEFKQKENKYELRIEELLKENKELNNRLHNDKDNLNNEIKKVMNEFNNNSIKNFNTCAEITKKTTNIAEILAKKCINAKPILKFTPENYDYNFTINKDFIRRFIYQSNQNKGQKFIGDYINGMFLKEDKCEQSMFSPDVVRFNYTFKEFINKNKSIWTIDKGAVKISELIIDPFINIISKYLDWYIKREFWKINKAGSNIDINYETDDEEEINEFYDEDKINRILDEEFEDSDEEDLYRKMKKLKKSKKTYKKLSNNERDMIVEESKTCFKIFNSIKDKSLHNDVIKYITKFYHLDKNFIE